MSNLEHLIENGLCRLDEGKSYREWREIMQEDCNWDGNENITLDNLWEICQYVIYTWDLEKENNDLLKEQEPIYDSYGKLRCGTCRASINSSDKFCSICGRKIKWK